MQGLRIACDTELKLQFVRDHEGIPGFDFLRIPRALHKPTEVLIVAEKLQSFKYDLEANGIYYEVFMEDVGSFIDQQFALELNARKANIQNDILKSFPRYSEVK
jgi:hypothetical protein